MRTLKQCVVALGGLVLVCSVGTGCTIYLPVPAGYSPSLGVPTGHLEERIYADVAYTPDG